MTDTVEKVARALMRALEQECWERMSRHDRQHYLNDSRAALYALTPGSRWALPDGTEMVAVPVEAVDLAMQGLKDWLVTYADDLCDANDAAVARDRIRSAGGTIAYISVITAMIAAASEPVASAQASDEARDNGRIGDAEHEDDELARDPDP